jgi:hypothetical protein
MPNPPGKPNPVYANYNSLKAELDAKCPLLELVTSEAEFQVLLQTRGNKGPSMIKIQLRNTDGKVVAVTAASFVLRQNQNLTKHEKEAAWNRLSDKNKGVFVSEAVSVEVLSQLFESN